MLSKIFCGNKKIFLIFAVLFFTFAVVSSVSAANSATDYIPLVNVPGVSANATLTQYLSGLYNFVISVVGIFAMAVIVYGGMRYLTSAGNPAAIEEAKDAIMSAIYGLILALMSWLIINIVNPDILVLKNPGVGLSAGTYSAGANTAKCSFGAGNGTAENPCSCIDGVKAVAGSAAGPVITGISIAPCSVNVPTSTSTITISFSEPLDPGSVSVGSYGGGTISTYFPGTPPVTGTLNASNSVLTITIGAPLAVGSPQEIIVTTGVKSAAGIAMSPAGCSAAAGVPPAATTAYDLRFTTASSFGGGVAACVSCSFGSSNLCDQVCSDKTKQASVIPDPPGKGYHCVGARILATGTNVVMNPDGISANMKVNGDVTLDGITNSIFPNSTIATNSKFEWTIVPSGFTIFAPAPNKITLYPGAPNPPIPLYPFTTAKDYNVKLVITPSATAPGAPQPVEAHFTMHVAP